MKTSNQLEKPRFAIIGFQKNRKGKDKLSNHFDACKLSYVKFFLNTIYYPYGNLNLDIESNRYALLYDMYPRFQQAYYSKENEPALNKASFMTYTYRTRL